MLEKGTWGNKVNNCTVAMVITGWRKCSDRLKAGRKKTKRKREGGLIKLSMCCATMKRVWLEVKEQEEEKRVPIS